MNPQAQTADQRPKTRDRFEGDHFLEAEDIAEGKARKLVIKEIIPANTVNCAKGQLIDKPILCFENDPKQLILGKTNSRIIKTLLGPHENKWIGQEIRLMRRYLIGCTLPTCAEVQPCIRVYIPPGTSMRQKVWDWYGEAKAPEPSAKPTL